MDDQDAVLELMVEMREGSSRALQLLIDRFWTELVRYAARELGQVDLAEDIVQDTFIYLWKRRRSWTPTGSPQAYLYRIVRNRLIDEKRKSRVRSRWARARERNPEPGPATPAEVLNCSAITTAFDKAVEALPERRREAFSLVFLRGLSHKVAAEVLGISKQTVSNHVSTALSEIRAAVARVSEKDPDRGPST